MTSNDLRRWITLTEGAATPADAFLAGWKTLAHTLDQRVEVVLSKESEHEIELESIEVVREARRRGLGTAVIHQITELADQTGANLVLYPEPSAIARLEPYYERFGFFSMNGGQSMIYEPRE